MPETSDEQLVRSFRDGDEAAFATFLDRHSARSHRLALIWLKDSTLAEDAVQEAFVRTYTGIHRFRFGASPSTWLLRILRNVCREMNRRRAFVPLAEDELAALMEDPHAAAEDAGRLAHLRQAMSELPERQRQVVGLRVLEELSIAETARIMGCREGTVKAHLNRATNNLKRRLGG